MNRKTKKIVSVLAVVLIILVGFAVFIGLGRGQNDSKQLKQSEEATQQTIQKEELVEEDVEDQEDKRKQEKKEEQPEEMEQDVVKIEIPEKAEAKESEWLAAAAVIGISLQYAEFEIEEIYVSEENNKETYIIFKSNGEQMVIHSKALTEERKEAGTKDIYTEMLGFSTFDEVSLSDVKKENMDLIELKELDELIAQSLLVSIYER